VRAYYYDPFIEFDRLFDDAFVTLPPLRVPWSQSANNNKRQELFLPKYVSTPAILGDM